MPQFIFLSLDIELKKYAFEWEINQKDSFTNTMINDSFKLNTFLFLFRGETVQEDKPQFGGRN